ncbi:putative unusual protein kinase regulating ubiquinone biosynthesis (AarF/ABC1/UbiB family) [Halospina denitrificans]|uniref:Putative unusual protein kinase regulating ubiquinone biosynthesis (AarF/ABC1/UbiB family) n=1 Tax=Halospina denitrificans TaxID=332522 RepID=A0A4V3EPU5_9GAMM|nr:AarF/ABC1/UbiB kinase family protein [Halospina denitrificans]TDT39308.1 putative unusual protein kinase regulating ubiquinone biosynthesis (AarF/ABC1/UbiB family) [Halospina denitrificans]
MIEINLPVLRERTGSALRGAGDFAMSTVRLPRAFTPVARLIMRDEDVTREELSRELDRLFEALYEHPLSEHSRSLTVYLRRYRLIPNEESTENLIRFMVKQVMLRSPVEIPDAIVDEFWSFFHELISAPELKGLVELNLDITRVVLRTYEPLLVDLANRVKELRRQNQVAMGDMLGKVQVLRSDLVILRRQIRAIRYIKPFLQTDPQDFHGQAQIVAKMVREFGPLFIKMAQVAAANADFLPDEIAKELAVFQEDVEPMTGDEVRQAFIESKGCPPEELYFDFKVDKPLKSGSIGSVYVAKKPVEQDGVEVLVPIIVKVARHNLEREFQMGSLAIELMLVSSQYWAPHSKLLPFLEAMSEQIKEFSRGFERELDFEEEAVVQNRFAERARGSKNWYVPEVYEVTGRILEMEFLDDAMSINRVLAGQTGRGRRRLQRRIAENFLFTVLEHLIVHQEFHGDLHPGNIMASPDGSLYLIDWGNVVDMRGKWVMIRDYLMAVLMGDTGRLADCLITMSTDPEGNRLRRDEIIEALDDTLAKKGVTPLTEEPLRRLYREGYEGLQLRLQTAAHLASNAYQLRLVLQSDYLHLSRSLMAMGGTYANLYRDMSPLTMARDFAVDVSLFPVNMLRQRLGRRRRSGNLLPAR